MLFPKCSTKADLFLKNIIRIQIGKLHNNNTNNVIITRKLIKLKFTPLKDNN